MNIVCKKCQSKFKFPDSKVPTGKMMTLPCPKCKNKIIIKPKKRAVPKKPKSAKKVLAQTGFAESDHEDAPLADVGFDTKDGHEKPFDFYEEEGICALVCEHDPENKRKLKHALQLLEYRVVFVETARDALKGMRYKTYDMVVLNEVFDCRNPELNGVLTYIQRLPMAVRRNMFIILLTDRFRTKDSMNAYHKSVNLVVNIDSINQFEKTVSQGLSEVEAFYSVFKSMLKKLK
ncbi:zinc-ribbon domain-containing protein [Desulfococcaceae bacterium HSG7]|nr:zinc-ribbon domain-containing protein [Desulfococcaceae bacterium HSG9]MDM8556891.1 zinc-ribbon domain-containing protein [Desulfococcaceae bacterium HSG7]